MITHTAYITRIISITHITYITLIIYITHILKLIFKHIKRLIKFFIQFSSIYKNGKQLLSKT